MARDDWQVERARNYDPARGSFSPKGAAKARARAKRRPSA